MPEKVSVGLDAKSLFANIAQATGVASASIADELGYIRHQGTVAAAVEQYIAFARTSDGMLLELAAGKETFVRKLGVDGFAPTSAIKAKLSFKDALAALRTANKAWVQSKTSVSTLAVSLQRGYMPGLKSGSSHYLAILTTAQLTHFGCVDAMTGNVLLQLTLPAGIVAPKVQPSLVWLWKLLKIAIAVLVLVAMFAAVPPAGELALLALAIAATIQMLSLVLLICLFLCNFSPNAKKPPTLLPRLRALKTRMEKLQSDFDAGSVAPKKVRTELGAIVDEFGALMPEVHEAVEESNATEHVEGAMEQVQKAFEAISHLLH